MTKLQIKVVKVLNDNFSAEELNELYQNTNDNYWLLIINSTIEDEG